MAKLKALPKALIIGVVLAGIGFAAFKLMPERKPVTPQLSETPVQATPPAAEAPTVTVAPAPVQPQPTPQPANEPAPTPATVTNGGAGLDSVLNAGKKK